MRLTTFRHDLREQLGFVYQDRVFELRSIDGRIASSMRSFLYEWELYFQLAVGAEERIRDFPVYLSNGIPLNEVEFLAPLPKPGSLRDGYAFRQHVYAGRRNRNLPMIPQFDAYPVFYFGNHHAVTGCGDVPCLPDHFDKLDFELEVAVIICKKGRNIRAENADDYIGGLTIMNDFSARTLQLEEMQLSLGPAKGKDFSTTLGPWLTTMDELKPFEVACKPGHTGKAWNLTMAAFVNGRKVSAGNLADMDWTFAEIIERASYGADLHPGDVIGSGTVGTGCFLEINGTAKRNNPEYQDQWLRAGDEISLTVDCLGTLSNRMIREGSDFSILGLKKKQSIPRDGK